MTQGLRLRLALRAGLFMAAALAGLGAVVEVSVVRPMVGREDQRLLSQVEGLADLVASEGPAGFRRYCATWVRPQRGEWAALVASSERGPSFAASEGRVPPGVEGGIPGGGPAVVEGMAPWGERAVSRDVKSADGRALRIVAGATLREIRDEQVNLRLLLGAAAFAGLALAGTGAWIGAGAVLRPLAAMTAAARRPAGGPSDLQLPVPADGGEFEELARLLNEYHSRTFASLEEERRFASEAAHELRAPLTLLRMRAERALASGEAESQREALRGSLEDCDRVARLVQALLELSRTPVAGAAAEGPPPDAGRLLAAMAEDFGSLAVARGLRFRFAEPPPAPLPVAAPAGVVETCVSVLLDNAFRYSPAESEVLLAVAADGDGVRITVSDQGPGVTAAESERVFERLFRGESGRNSGKGGFGLGLPLARRLARSAGGDVVLVNPGEPGARFAVLLAGPPPG